MLWVSILFPLKFVVESIFLHQSLLHIPTIVRLLLIPAVVRVQLPKIHVMQLMMHMTNFNKTNKQKKKYKTVSIVTGVFENSFLIRTCTFILFWISHISIRIQKLTKRMLIHLPIFHAPPIFCLIPKWLEGACILSKWHRTSGKTIFKLQGS